MAENSKKILSLDIGGTKTAIGLVDPDDWRVLIKKEMPTDPRSGRQSFLERLVVAVRAMGVEGFGTIGIGIAGLVDFEHGILLKSPNLTQEFDNFVLAKSLEDEFGRPTAMDNDVRCFSLAEATIGSGRGFRHVFGVTIGTGIGGCMVIDGRVLRGRDNAAGEVGHMTVAMDSPIPCGCGGHGHFEALASGSALERLFGKKTTGEEVLALADSGDRRAQEALETLRGGLAVGFANIAYAYNPDVVVVGGGLGGVEGVWRPAVALAEGKISYPPVARLDVRRSVLGVSANLVGAAMMASERLPANRPLPR
jgi:glucokinase